MTGVLLMAHGTPSSLDEMPAYLTLVRGGRPPSDELVAEMRHNYEAIGGRSPLTAITEAQAEALRGRLGREVPVAVGMRNWSPFIKDALAGLAAMGVTRVVGIPMAPQFSTLSVENCGAIGMPTTRVTPAAASPASASLMNGDQLRMPTATGTSGPSLVRSSPACASVMSVNGERPPIAA